MKKCKFFSAALLVASLVFNAGLLRAAGDFKAISLKTGHAGMSFGDVDFTGTDITVELWLNLESSTFSTTSGILSNMGVANQGFLFCKRASSAATNNENTLRFFVKPLSGTNNVDLRIPLADVTEKWTHVAFVVSSSDNKAYLYVNGNPYSNSLYTIADYDVATGGFKGNTNGRLTDVKLGSVGSEAKPNGKFADLRIWSVARTAEEIKTNYNRHLEGDQTGLFVNFIFDETLQNVQNYGSAARVGVLNPSATWETVFAFETLAQQPKNLALSGKTLSWDTNDGAWEVSLYKQSDNSLVGTNDASIPSLSLIDKGLENGVAYYARVRTVNNGFYSGSAFSETFSFTDLPTGIDLPNEAPFATYSENGTLVIFSETVETLPLTTLDGRLVREVRLSAGKATVEGLAHGVYLMKNRKVVITSK